MDKFFTTKTVNINTGESMTQLIDLRSPVRDDNLPASPGLRLVGVWLPAAWTASVLTVVAYQSEKDTTGGSVYLPDGTELTIASATGLYLIAPQLELSSIGLFKLRSGTRAAPVNQAAPRTLVLALRAYD